MESWKIVGILGLVALLIPLSGCIGEEDTAPTPKVAGGSEVAEGAPPDKFSFEPTNDRPTGEVTREHRTRETGLVPVPPVQRTVDEWRFTWNVSGLQDLGTGEDGEKIGEAFYTVWLGKQEDDKILWEVVAKSESFAKDGEISGASTWKRAFGDYVGLRVSLEVKADSQAEITLLETTGFEPQAKETSQQALQHLKPFGPAFADAKVVTTKDGKVNLTVSAYTLPETEGSYDLFLRNDGGNHYLGTLKLDPASGGLALAMQPDPKLFTKYQFFISIEHPSDKKEEAGGYVVMKSSFKG